MLNTQFDKQIVTKFISLEITILKIYIKKYITLSKSIVFIYVFA